MIIRKKCLISESRRRLLEMAFSKHDYQKQVDDLMDQIAQNWCLCQFCHKSISICPERRKNAPNFIDYPHWKSELETHLDHLKRKRIKGNNDQKKKWTTEIIIKIGEFNNISVIKDACATKIKREKRLFVSEKEFDIICNDFAESINEIIDCITGDIPVYVYTDRWFPEV